MSTQRKAEFTDHPVSEEAVHDFLADHPDFFERHGDLLKTLRLPHGSGGTVSLVERQVSMLRQKELRNERKLKELLAVARANDALGVKIHQLTLQLLRSDSLAETLSCVEETLRSSFDADHSILILFGDPDDFKNIKAGRIFRAVPRDSETLKPFETFLAGNAPRCGQVRDSQRDFLFGQDTNEIGSAALVPLGRGAEVGFLGIGSADADRFHPGMSIDFLRRLGELVAEALKRY